MKLVGSLAALAFIVVWFFTLRPTFLGGPMGYIIVSGHSMEPTFWTGDLVLTRKQASYKPGDIVAFHADRGNVIHRIIDGDPVNGFNTQGDNNSFVDGWHPTPLQIIGKKWVEFDGAGKKLQSLRKPRLFATFVAGMASFSFISLKEVKRRRRRGKPMLKQHTSTQGGSGRDRFSASTWAIAGLGLTVLLVIMSGFLALTALRTPRYKTHDVERLRYDQTGAFDYMFTTQPSTLYPSGVVGPVTPPASVALPSAQAKSVRPATAPGTVSDTTKSPNNVTPPPVYTRGARKIDVGFKYALNSSLPPTVSGELSADLLIRAQGDGGWVKTQQLLEPTPFEGPTAEGRFSIDFGPVQGLIDTIEKETGYTPAGYDLVIQPKVTINGNLGAEPVQESYSPAFTIKYTKTTITADSSLLRSEPKSIGAPIRQAQKIDFLGRKLSVPTARQLFLGMTLAALAGAAAFAGVVFLGIGQDEATQVRARYGMKLVPVTDAENYGSNRVQVSRLQDLAVLAQRDGKIVFSQHIAGGELYFVPDGAVTYEYAYYHENKGA